MNFKWNKERLIIVLTVFVDVLGIGIVIPIMPFYVESFGVSAFTVTLLFSVFSLFSFVSAPILGALSDKLGRRPILIISILSSAVGWFVFASAHAVWVLFLGRIIDGMAAGNFPIAQSYLADLSKGDKERTQNMGIIGAVFGIGLITGPAIGSVLSAVAPAFPFWFAGGLALANMIAALFFLPETHLHRDHGKEIRINPFAPLWNAARDRLLRAHYGAWFLFGLAVAVWQAVFALYMGQIFNFNASRVGTVFTAMGILMVLNQGIGLKYFWLKYFRETSLELWLLLFFALAFLLMGAAYLAVFLTGMILCTLSQSVLRVVMSSRVSGMAGYQRRGETLGIMASVMSVAMVIGPLAGGALFSARPQLPFFLSAVLLFAAFIVMKKFRGQAQNITVSEEDAELSRTI